MKKSSKIHQLWDTKLKKLALAAITAIIASFTPIPETLSGALITLFL